MTRRLLMAARGGSSLTLPPVDFGDWGTGQGDSGLVGTSLTKLGIVLARGTAGAWDDDLVESPAVWYDPYQEQYGMVYVGYGTGHPSGAIGLAWADDPEGPWTKDPANPILDGSGSGTDSAGCSGPFIWLKDGTYHLFYIGLTGAGYESGTKTLNHATSPDLYDWTRLGAIISPGTGWRHSAIWHPCVVKDGGTYYLFFNAQGGHEAIGYATSSDLDSWVVDDANSPVLDIGAGGTWDDGWIGDPSLYLVGGTWWMAYYGYDGFNARDGLAEATTFPTDWDKYVGNPVLSPSESYDSTHAHKPYIFQTDSGMWHYYTAVAAEREIAVARVTA